MELEYLTGKQITDDSYNHSIKYVELHRVMDEIMKLGFKGGTLQELHKHLEELYNEDSYEY